jgi:hypothetical protein
VIDPKAGILRMRFLLNGKLEDQGVGFAVQDGVVFSTSACLTSSDREDPPKGRFDIAVSVDDHVMLVPV